MMEPSLQEIDAIELKISRTTAQVAEARRSLSQRVPDLSPVTATLDEIENWFARHDRGFRRQFAGPLIGLHEEIEGMIQDLWIAKQSASAMLAETANQERAQRAYTRHQAHSSVGHPSPPFSSTFGD